MLDQPHPWRFKQGVEWRSFGAAERPVSKAIYICSRNSPMGNTEEIRIRDICRKLTPDILASSVKHRVSVSGKIAFGVVNDNPCVIQKGDSLLLGLLYEKSNNWDEPRARSPDGSYAIFRSNGDYCEIVSDPAASRTLWYYFDDEVFVASTSQRAIVNFLGSFIFDERVIPWMLSSGSLGPEYSWDRRLRRLGPDSSLLLDRNSWTISQKQAVIEFAEVKRTAAEHEELLTAAIRTTIRSLDADSLDTWALPLSGGHDSRALLCFIAELEGASEKLQTLTWGLKASIRDENNDASIAKKLSEHFGVKHHYYHTDLSDEPVEDIIERFIVCGEGRVDHLAGYLDGFQLWKSLYQSGINGIFRGDVGLVRKPVFSKQDVMESVGSSICEDFSNFEDILPSFGLAPQHLPAGMEKHRKESLQQWRDRLYHSYRLPTVLAALSDLKLTFVEQASPLLSRDVLDRVRELPDALRARKVLLNSIVDRVGPDVAYANRSATATAESALKRPDCARLLRSRIDSDRARLLFNEGFVRFILDGVRAAATESVVTTPLPSSKLKNIVPQFIKRRLRYLKSKPSLNGNILAFRVFLVVCMHELLSTDTYDIGVNKDGV